MIRDTSIRTYGMVPDHHLVSQAITPVVGLAVAGKLAGVEKEGAEAGGETR
jgi:hypothetical protein